MISPEQMQALHASQIKRLLGSASQNSEFGEEAVDGSGGGTRESEQIL